MDGISYLNPLRPDIVKAPAASLVYGFDWREWLAREGATIATADVPAPAGLGVTSVAHQDGVVSCIISGGTEGTEYQVTCTITTAAAPVQTESRSLWIMVGAR